MVIKTGSCMLTRYKPDVIQKYRNFSMLKESDFKDDLYFSGLLECDNFNTLNGTYEDFSLVLRNLVDKHCPLISKSVRSTHKKNKWFDSEIRALRRKRRAAERTWKKHPTDNSLTHYKYLQKQITLLVKRKRNGFLNNYFSEVNGDDKLLYSRFKESVGLKMNDNLPNFACADQLSNQFCNYFSRKIELIRLSITEKLNSTNDQFHIPSINLGNKPKVESLENFAPITDHELFSIINSLNDKQCDLNEIPAWLLKACMVELASIILFIVNEYKRVNESFRTCVFPLCLKQALVRPVVKNPSVDLDSLSNYRPIHNLSFLSKICEKAALLLLLDHLKANDLFCNVQSGYRSDHSCETVMIKCIMIL